MKKNEDGNRSVNKKNIYRKQSLDDTNYGFRMDDYDVLPDGTDTDYVEGVDDIDHFDFDENDVETFRRLDREREKATDSKKVSQKVRIKNLKTTAKVGRAENASIVHSDDEKRWYDKAKNCVKLTLEEETEQGRIQRQKRRTNKEIMRVTYVMLALFFGMLAYFIYFDAVGSADVINNIHNSRLAKLADQVIRGNIVSADGEILAETITDSDGNSYRYYPYGSVFAHVIGTSTINQSGVELSADSMLKSSDIQSLQKIINEISGQKNQGNTVVTTLDSTLQQIAYEALGDKQGVVVVLEPSTGKVLAMVSKPDYDPNTLEENYSSILADTQSKVLLNQATQGLFVPGSIFKIVTALAYLRSGQDVDSYSYTCTGKIALDADGSSVYLKCSGSSSHGTLSLLQSFAKSCNSSFANMSLSISVETMIETAESLLFNESLPSAFTTTVSQFSLSEDDSEWLTGATAIGQGNTVMSPLHAAMIVSAIANGGVLMEPYVIDAVESADGTVVEKYMPSAYGILMTATEAATLTELMEAVVTSGTATALSGKSYTVAGKTGTAEVSGSGNNAWFVGFAPVDNPEIVVCVLVEDASGTASTETVPIAAKLFEAYLNP